MVRDFGDRERLAVGRPNQRARQACCGSKRNGVGQPDANGNRAIGQAQIGRDFAEPVAGHLVRHLLDGEAVAAGGNRIDGPRDLGVALLHADDVDDAVDLVHHLLDRFRELRETIGIVAEDLHLDRFGIAFEIAEHVLQQLHELDLDERRGLRARVRARR